MDLFKIQFDIISVITAIGIFHGFFLALLLVKIKGGNRAANKILSVFLMNLSICILYAIVIPTGMYLEFPHLAFQSRPFQFLSGPLLYFYVKILTTPSGRFKRKNMLHM